MHVWHYLVAVFQETTKTFKDAWGLVAILVPAIVVIAAWAIPGVSTNVTFVLAVLAVAWFAFLLLVWVPARVWDRHRKELDEREAFRKSSEPMVEAIRAIGKAGSSGPSVDMSNARIENVSFYLTDGAGQIVSSAASSAYVGTATMDAVIFPAGTVHAQAGAAIAAGEAHDATVETVDNVEEAEGEDET